MSSKPKPFVVGEYGRPIRIGTPDLVLTGKTLEIEFMKPDKSVIKVGSAEGVTVGTSDYTDPDTDTVLQANRYIYWENTDIFDVPDDEKGDTWLLRAVITDTTFKYKMIYQKFNVKK